MTDDKSERIKVLYLLQTFRTGGSERIVMDLCQSLDPSRFSFCVAALVGGILQDDFNRLGIPTLCAYKDLHGAREVMRQISAFVKKHQIRVISAHHFTPFFYGFYAAKRHGCKIFYTAHTCPEVDLFNDIWSLVGRVLLSFSNGAIGISHDVSASMKKQFHLSGKKTHTIVNVVNAERFDLHIDVRKKKRELGVRSYERIIGAVGSLRRQKNYPNLIKAFQIVRKEMGNVKLLIVGEGKRNDDLESLVKKLQLEDKALLLGARLDVPEIMKAVDVYCLPSLFEGLPLSLLEAMCAGVPVVGTNVVGIRDVISHEKTGLLVPPDDPEQLAEALIRVLNDSALGKRLSGNAHQYVLEKHGKARWIAENERLLGL